MDYAIDSRLSTGRPFFLASGFRKPHAPWQAPQRMYDLYNESALHTADPDVFSSTAPLIAWSSELSVQLENGTRFPFSPFKAVPRWVQQDQRHAYYAAISYVDEHVGAMLNKLDEAGLRNETIIVFHADHGYLLSEHGYVSTVFD
jgi:iduronate 2-sulfatase